MTNSELQELRRAARVAFKEMDDYIDYDYPLNAESLRDNADIEQFVRRARSWFRARDLFVEQYVFEKAGPWASIQSALEDKFEHWPQTIKWCDYDGQCSLECSCFDNGCTWFKGGKNGKY